MLTVKQIWKVMEFRSALGLNPMGDGSCFGVQDPSRLRPPMPTSSVLEETKEKKKKGKVVTVSLRDLQGDE